MSLFGAAASTLQGDLSHEMSQGIRCTSRNVRVSRFIPNLQVKYMTLSAYTAISPGANHECEHLAAEPIGVLE